MSWILSAFADEAGANVDEQIKALQRAGYNYIDLRSVNGHNIAELPVDLARQVKCQLDDAGIKVNMLGSPIGKIDVADDVTPDLDRLRHLGQMAEVFSCNQIRIFSYYNRKENWDKPRWQDESIARLGKLKDLAKQLNLVLFHENERHIFGDRCGDIQAIATALRDGQVFRLIFDFDNFNQSGDNVWENWLKLRDVTDAFHLKESDKDNRHVPVGTGAGYVPEILSDALKRNWTGPLSLEPHLRHSKAVMATGPSGKANESFADMSAADCFHVAAQTATKLLSGIGAAVA